MNARINQLLETEEDAFGLCWLGNDSWLIGAQGHMIATDLDLCNVERAAPPPIPLEEVAPALSYLMITHEHADHFNRDTCKYLAVHSPCRFLLPESCRQASRQCGLPEGRIRWVAPGNTYSPEPWLQLETVRALHGHIRHSVYEGANLMDCGYVLTFCGHTLFQPGDTVLLHQHFSIGPLDVLFVSPTEHNTYLEDSKTLIELTRPAHILPQHFGTYQVTEENYFYTVGYPDELYAGLAQEYKEKFIKPTQGDFILIQ